MNENQWHAELATYRTPGQVARECLEGISDHIGTKCKTGQTQTVATRSAGSRGLPPFHEEPVTCDRGSSGCNLEHNDAMAMRFAEMGFQRIVELTK